MNYIVSKLSLIDFIKDTIENVTGISDGSKYVFADLFAGTGIVGSTFKASGWNVISNDIQYYSYVLNKHFIENNEKVDSHLLDYLNSLCGVEGFIYNNYCPSSASGRYYFTDFNGKKCDSIRIELEKLYSKGKINDQEYFYYLASLINSIDKYANTASVYGAFLKNFKKTASREFTLGFANDYRQIQV